MDNGHEPASDRTTVRRVTLEDGRVAFRVRSPDGGQAYLPPWALLDLLSNEATRQQARRELWDSPVPFRVAEH
jgi:hypothetical protein